MASLSLSPNSSSSSLHFSFVSPPSLPRISLSLSLDTSISRFALVVIIVSALPHRETEQPSCLGSQFPSAALRDEEGFFASCLLTVSVCSTFGESLVTCCRCRPAFLPRTTPIIFILSLFGGGGGGRSPVLLLLLLLHGCWPRSV